MLFTLEYIKCGITAKLCLPVTNKNVEATITILKEKDKMKSSFQRHLQININRITNLDESLEIEIFLKSFSQSPK